MRNDPLSRPGSSVDGLAHIPEGTIPRRGRVGLRVASLVLVATVLPVACLIWASAVARAQVERRALEGLSATAKATALQERQAWDGAVKIVTAGASRPVPINALQTRDTALAARGVQNLLITGPFADVRLYDSAANLVAIAAMPETVPTPMNPADSGPVTVGIPVTTGIRTSRQVSVAVAGGVGGRLVVDVDVTQLLGRPEDLAFARTGTSSS